MRPKSTGTRRVYWIASAVDERQREKAFLLSQHGFEVSFFTDSSALVAQVGRVRPAIFVLASVGDITFERRMLAQLTAMAEIRSAKMVLVCDVADEALCKLASCFNFRDILPLDFPVRWTPKSPGEETGPSISPWIQRFVYSTSSRPKIYTPPARQVTMSLVATIGVPARISWISPSQICIESRLRPQIGDTIKVAGPIADWFGLPYLEAKVESGSRQKLRYHFSQGYVASWSPPAGSDQQTKSLLDQFSTVSRLPRPRVYVAVQDGLLRDAVLKTLDGGHYEVAAALQKQALADEPMFFTPDFVILEASLTTKENLRLIVGLMAALKNQIGIVILGPNSLGEQLQILYPHHRFEILPDATAANVKHGLTATMTRLRALSANFTKEEGETHDIPSTHSMSQAEVQVPGVITAMHPGFLQIHLDTAVAQYALIRVMHPLFEATLQRNVFGKITASRKLERDSEHDTPAHMIDCYLADINGQEAQSLAKVVWQEISGELSRFLPSLMEEMRLGSGAIAAPSRSPALEVNQNPLPQGASAVAEAFTKEPRATPESPLKDAAEARFSDRQKTAKNTSKSREATPHIALDVAKTLAIVGVGVICLWLFFRWLSEYVEPSGGVYSEQLKKFAPQLKTE